MRIEKTEARAQKMREKNVWNLLHEEIGDQTFLISRNSLTIYFD